MTTARIPAELVQVGDVLALTNPAQQIRITAARVNPTTARIDLAAIDTMTAKPVYLTDLNPTRLFDRVATDAE